MKFRDLNEELKLFELSKFYFVVIMFLDSGIIYNIKI